MALCSRTASLRDVRSARFRYFWRSEAEIQNPLETSGWSTEILVLTSPWLIPYQEGTRFCRNYWSLAGAVLTGGMGVFVLTEILFVHLLVIS